jgi:transcriptional regulator with XRE-family HTH domain
MPERHTKPSVVFGRQIFNLRRQRYWTQRDLACRAGLSEAIVASMEQGLRSNPRLCTMLKLARAFGVTLNELVPPGV